ncbi:MAG: TetR/AcrR family transcriptional regulator [Bdellovibrionaceae bacterium]|nr:TetR/AcrR family transcriptional regulator [Pseudobdellovibrionaceae bacterium]
MNSPNDFGSANDPGLDSRKKLIEVAVELFSKKGFHAVSVREICHQAGLNISLISYYFAGKEGLLVAALEELSKGQLERVEVALGKFESRIDFEVRLKGFLNGMVKMYLENPLLIRLFLEELEKQQEGAERVFSQTFYKTWECFTDFLKRGRLAGYLRSVTSNDRIIALQILSPFLGLMRTSVSSKKFYQISLDDKDFKDDVIDQILYGVLKSENLK